MVISVEDGYLALYQKVFAKNDSLTCVLIFTPLDRASISVGVP